MVSIVEVVVDVEDVVAVDVEVDSDDIDEEVEVDVALSSCNASVESSATESSGHYESGLSQ